MERPKSLKDILAGLIFMGIAVAFGVAASGYEFGTALRMGPGYFPLVLAGALGVLGAVMLVQGVLASAEDSDLGVVPWRALALLLGAIIFFGVTVKGLGLAPAVFVTATVSAFASRENGVGRALLIGAALTLFCVLIFGYGLGVAVPIIGPWLS